MAVLVSGKGSDITVWRAAGNFSVAFRQELLDRSAGCPSEEAQELFARTERALDDLADAHDACLAKLDGIIRGLAAGFEPTRFKELTGEYYGLLYDHFDRYRSATAFFQLSGLFLRELAGALTRHALQQRGLAGCPMPDMALVALGAAGRQEFSPYCQLQLALVHGGTDSAAAERVSLYSGIVLEGFLACGLQVDKNIAPSNPFWQGTLGEWDQRVSRGLENGKPQELVELLRLAERETLHTTGGLDDEFTRLVAPQIQQSHRAMADLVRRLLALSNGLGIMGGWRLARSGPERGLFRLFAHALLPYSAAVTALALINRVNAAGTAQRIRELLELRVMNVEVAERLLQSWHTLNELRLREERQMLPDWTSSRPLYLDVTQLDDADREAFRDALETIDATQRQVSVLFSGRES